jgi:succinyl-CoA synthetase beta subunit
METKAFQALKQTPQLADQVFAAMEALQTLLLEHLEILNIEVNPLVINQDGVWAADIKMQVQMVKSTYVKGLDH